MSFSEKPTVSKNSKNEFRVKSMTNEKFRSMHESEKCQAKFKLGEKLLREKLGERFFCELKNDQPYPDNYRHACKFAVRKSADESKRFAVGLFKPGTHDVDPDNTSHFAQQHRDLNNLIKKIIEDLESEHSKEILPYDEGDHSGDLRYVIARLSSHYLSLQVTYSFREVTPQIKKWFKKHIARLKEAEINIQSAYLSENSGVNNVILTPELTHVYGRRILEDKLAEIHFSMGPLSFFQVNPYVAEQIYLRIAQLCGFANKNELVWDLYCGVGPIGLFLARHDFRVLGIEEIPEAVEYAKLNSLSNDFSNNKYVAGRLDDQISQLDISDPPKIVTINPSRRGIDKETAESLVDRFENPYVERVVYLSCNVETLARDLQILTGKSFKVTQVEAFDMAPQTSQLEWLAVLTR